MQGNASAEQVEARDDSSGREVSCRPQAFCISITATSDQRDANETSVGDMS